MPERTEVYFRNWMTTLCKEPLRMTLEEEHCRSHGCCNLLLVCISPKWDSPPQRKLNSVHLQELLWERWLLCVKLLAQIHPPLVSKQLSPKTTILLITGRTCFAWWLLFKHTPISALVLHAFFPSLSEAPSVFHLGPSFLLNVWERALHLLVFSWPTLTEF